MADYFWSARFICGAVTLALGVALLVGGLLFLIADAGALLMRRPRVVVITGASAGVGRAAALQAAYS